MQSLGRFLRFSAIVNYELCRLNFSGGVLHGGSSYRCETWYNQAAARGEASHEARGAMRVLQLYLH